MSEPARLEIDQNYDFFQRQLSTLLPEHQGEFALLRSGTIVDFFLLPGEAYRAGLARFPDGVFSIQEVDDRPASMGLMSLAFD